MSAAELTLNVTEFKARSLALLEDIAKGRLTKITVTKRGKPLAVVSPSPLDQTERTIGYGFMKGTGRVMPGVDLTEPMFPEDDPWEEEWLENWDSLNKAP
jgi:antitoxin (DNA-binding transcriptional repressor) of toxin-antitoxin stability system